VSVLALEDATNALRIAIDWLIQTNEEQNVSIENLELSTNALQGAVDDLNIATNIHQAAITALNDSTNTLDTSVIELRASTNYLYGIRIPVGTILPYGGSTAPGGYNLCDGSVAACALYPALFAVIGYTYGGAGATFNVPNLQAKFPLGTGGGYARGATGGTATETLTVAQLPAHTHTAMPRGAYLGGQYCTSFTTGIDQSLGLGNNTVYAQSGTTGSGSSHNNVPPYLVINFIIKLR